MNTFTRSFRSIGLVLLLGTVGLSAQSCAAVNTLGNASGHALNASGELAASGAASVKGSVQAGSAIVAVPVWMSGAAVSGVGALSSALGESATKVGEKTIEGGDKLWDFAADDAAQRPAMERNRAVPPAPAAAPAKTSGKAKDPSPAEALKRS